MTPKAKEPKTEPKPEPKEDEMPNALIPFAQLKDQYALPLDQVRQLIRSEQTPTDVALRQAVEVAKMFGVPLQGINLIPSRNGINVYINADGIRWKLHTDPRGLKCVETHIIQIPTRDNPLAIVEGRIEFKDGASFTNIGAVVVDGDNKGGKGKWNEADALMKAATKAKRRAGQDAVGTTLPTYEDFIEYRDTEMKDITPMLTVAQSVNGDSPKTLSEFLVKLNASGIDVDAACQKLQVTAITEVKDYKAAWETLKP